MWHVVLSVVSLIAALIAVAAQYRINRTTNEAMHLLFNNVDALSKGSPNANQPMKAVTPEENAYREYVKLKYKVITGIATELEKFEYLNTQPVKKPKSMEVAAPMGGRYA